MAARSPGAGARNNHHKAASLTYFVTPPLKIVDKPADANHKGGQRLGYRVIVLHATGGKDSTAWLSTTSKPPVSVHRLIKKDGTIYKIVPDNEVAWHAGPAAVGRLPTKNETINNWSLGIEIENLNDGRDTYPDAQITSVVAQVIEWWALYGALPITSHLAIQSNKHDPAGFPWPGFYAKLFKRLGELL